MTDFLVMQSTLFMRRIPANELEPKSMSIAERLFAVVNTLPEQQTAEALDLTEFLLARQRQAQEENLYPHLSVV